MTGLAAWVEACAGVLGEDGPFGRDASAFVPRSAQQDMALAVGAALDRSETLLVEAGTGTGKTYAYLVPALLSGKRVVISTGTKNLQDQIYSRDLPRVRAALASPVRTALLKGRNNYLCLHRLERARTEPRSGDRQTLSALDAWARATVDGELAEFGEPAQPVRALVTSTADNCLGAKCPEFERCFVVKARRAAQAADVVVVNHHLLLSDFRLKEEGFGVLPGAQAVIVDEAHQLPDLAPQFFGERLSTRQLADLVRDAHAECVALGDMPDLSAASQQLAEAVAEAEALLAPLAAREAWDAFRARAAAPEVECALGEALAGLTGMLKTFCARSATLQGLADRAQLTSERWRLLTAPDAPVGWVRWVEGLGRGGVWNAAPVESAEAFGRLFSVYPGAWVFTSATLSALPDFDDFRAALGLDGADALRLDSPFDYRRQARLFLPPSMPDPGASDYSEAVTEALLPLLRASRGGAFVLCTSRRALHAIARRLREAASGFGTVLAQDEAGRTELLERFSAAGDAVLVATSSFWEGVDVKGPALRLVAIDKLPFPAPGDPLLEARMAAIRQRGGSPFNDYQMPRAMLALRQGVGRLIRDPADRGLIVLCDPRLRSRGYGRRMLASLPPIPQIGTLRAACDWMMAKETA